MKWGLLVALAACSAPVSTPQLKAVLAKTSLLTTDVAGFALHIACATESGDITGVVSADDTGFFIITPLQKCIGQTAKLSLLLTTDSGVSALRSEDTQLLVGQVDALFQADRIGEVDLEAGVTCVTSGGETISGRAVLRVGDQTLVCSDEQTHTISLHMGERLPVGRGAMSGATSLQILPDDLTTIHAGAAFSVRYRFVDAAGMLVPLDDINVELLLGMESAANAMSKQGVVEFTLTAPRMANSYFLSARGGGVNSSVTQVAVLPGPVKTLLVNGPTNVANGVLTTYIVQALDAFGNLSDTNEVGSYSVAPSPLPDGLLTFTRGKAEILLTFADPGAYDVTANLAGVQVKVHVIVTLFSTVTHLKVSAVSVVGAGDDLTVSVQALNASDMVVGSYGASGTLTTDDPQVTGTFQFVFTSGVASVLLQLKTAGGRILSVHSGTFVGTFSVGVVAGMAASLHIVTAPTGQVCGSQSIDMQVHDMFGNITTFGGILQLSDSIDGGLGGATGPANIMHAWVSSGPHNLTLTASGLAPANLQVNVSDAPAHSLTWSQQPGDTQANVGITPFPTVQRISICGTLVTGGSDNISLAIGVNPSGGTLSGLKVVNSAGSTATFNNVSINLPGDGYTLIASAPGLNSAESSAFNITSGSAGNLIYVDSSSVNSPDGSLANPFQDIQSAIAAATGPSGPYEIRVAEGPYSGPITVDRVVTISGGWSTGFGVQDANTHFTSISCPSGAQTILFGVGAVSGTELSQVVIAGSLLEEPHSAIRVVQSAMPYIHDNRIWAGSDSGYERVGIDVESSAGATIIANNLIHAGSGGASKIGARAASPTLTTIVNNTFYNQAGVGIVIETGSLVELAANHIAGTVDYTTGLFAIKVSNSATWSAHGNRIVHCGAPSSVVVSNAGTNVSNLGTLSPPAFNDNAAVDSTVCDTSDFGFNDMGGIDSDPTTFADIQQAWIFANPATQTSLNSNGSFCGSSGTSPCHGPAKTLARVARAQPTKAGAY